MTKSGKHQFADDRRIDAADQNSDGEESADVSSSSIESPAAANPSISRRLTDIFMEDGNEDLLLQSSDIGDGFLQWLQALDMQVMGACRADERLKPLLKLNISSGEAEDRLLAQLCEQHFEPSEVGLLARCLCAPLVSIRVGKINKKGTLLSPTSIRSLLLLLH
ncbi:flocculation protein [Perilla frutescens var. hirtella]|uniref:Flocculation protein n=1 Tax=Perilla frutescens var. hirtella TaxID=608512 RepID=A0AAD4J4U9_PERFH|nr:flocculation protein [Perilla frutescens var. hirtella]